MTTLTCIAAVPVDTDYDNFTDSLKGQFSRYKINFTDMAFTKVINGKRLVVVDLESPNNANPRGALRSLIQANKLDWDILRLQDWSRTRTGEDQDGNPVYEVKTHGQQADLSAWLEPQPILDENGVQTGTYLPGLHVKLGQEPWVAP